MESPILSPTTPQTSSPMVERTEHILINELGTQRDALQAYSKLLCGSGQSVRLHCTVPTYCDMDSDETYDLQDLHNMRTRCLLFVNELMATLRSSGVPASYRLAPSNSTCCMVCSVPTTGDATQARHDAIAAVSHTRYSRDKMLLADLKSGPAIIIT